MNKKHMSFDEISEQFDLMRDGKPVSESHLGECPECIEELKKLTGCIGVLEGYKKIIIVDTDMFMNGVMSGCRKKRLKLIWSNTYYRHSVFAAAAVAAVIMIIPIVTPNGNVRQTVTVAENSAAPDETEITVSSGTTDEIIYFLKRHNFRIISVENDRVIAESRYRDFLHLKNAVAVGSDGSLAFLSKRYLSLAGTASGNVMYVPGGDRKIQFSVVIKK